MTQETIDELTAQMASYYSPSQPIAQPALPIPRRQTRDEEVWNPTLQALIEAAAWGIFALYCIVASVAATFIVVRSGLALWEIPFVIALLVVAWALHRFAKRVSAIFEDRRTLWRREKAEDRDIDGDGIVGPPETERQYTLVDGMPTVETEQHLYRRKLAGEDGKVRITRAPDGTRVYVAHLLDVVEYGTMPDRTRVEGVKGFTVPALETLLKSKPRPDGNGSLREYVGAILDQLTALGIVSQRGGPGNKTSVALVSLAEARRRIGEK